MTSQEMQFSACCGLCTWKHGLSSYKPRGSYPKPTWDSVVIPMSTESWPTRVLEREIDYNLRIRLAPKR